MWSLDSGTEIGNHTATGNVECATPAPGSITGGDHEMQDAGSLVSHSKAERIQGAVKMAAPFGAPCM